MTQSTCPFGAGFDFTDPDVLLQGIPVTEFAELRKTAPVWWNDQQESIFDDGGYWVITRHEDIKAISRNGDLWSTNRKGAVMRLPDGVTSEQLDLTFSLIHAPAGGQYYKANQKNSGFTIDQGGQAASLQAVWLSDNVTYTNKLSYKMVQTSRDADSNVNKQWRWSEEKNWGNPYRNGVLSNNATRVNNWRSSALQLLCNRDSK